MHTFVNFNYNEAMLLRLKRLQFFGNLLQDTLIAIKGFHMCHPPNPYSPYCHNTHRKVTINCKAILHCIEIIQMLSIHASGVMAFQALLVAMINN